MRFFLDTANVEHIKVANDMGVICGVTTNPSLIAKEGRDFNETIKEITEIVDGPISGEVISEDSKGMIKEGREISKIHPNMIVKIPITIEAIFKISDNPKSFWLDVVDIVLTRVLVSVDVSLLLEL